MRINKTEIEKMEQRYRALFINSLAGFRQVVLVGTKSLEGNNNLAIFNSLIHLGANPALYGLINRPDSVQRDTLQNILETREYSLNFVDASIYKKAHQTSARYEKDISEFDKVGLTPSFHSDFKAPFVEEAIVKISMNLEDTIPISINGTILIIGSIVDIEINKELIGNDGFVDLSASKTLICQGLDAYFDVNSIGRLPYAKP